MALRVKKPEPITISQEAHLLEIIKQCQSRQMQAHDSGLVGSARQTSTAAAATRRDGCRRRRTPSRSRKSVARRLRWPRRWDVSRQHRTRRDLDEGVERSAARVDLRGRVRGTAVMERALEEQMERTGRDRACVEAAVERLARAGDGFRERKRGRYAGDSDRASSPGRPLSAEGAEEPAQVPDEKLRLLDRREVPAGVEDRPVGDVVRDVLDEGAGRPGP